MDGYNPSISCSFSNSHGHPSLQDGVTPFLYPMHLVDEQGPVFDIPLKASLPQPINGSAESQDYANKMGNGLILRLIFHPGLCEYGSGNYYTFGWVQTTNGIVGKILNAGITDFDSMLPLGFTLQNGIFAYLGSASPIFVKSYPNFITIKPSDLQRKREMPDASEYPSEAGVSSVPGTDGHRGNLIYRTGLLPIGKYSSAYSDTAFGANAGISSRSGMNNGISFNPDGFCFKEKTVSNDQSSEEVQLYPLYKISDNVADYNLNSTSISGTYTFLQYYGSCYQQRSISGVTNSQQIFSLNYINNYSSITEAGQERAAYTHPIDKNATNINGPSEYYVMRKSNLPFIRHSSYGITGFMTINSPCIDNFHSVSYFNNGAPIISSICVGPISIAPYTHPSSPERFYFDVFKIDDYHFAGYDSGNTVIQYIPAHGKVCLDDSEEYIVIKPA